jgi:hypothetical protein
MFSSMVVILLILIINFIFYLIPTMFPRISFFDIVLFQIFINCMFLFYFVLPQEHSEFKILNE